MTGRGWNEFYCDYSEQFILPPPFVIITNPKLSNVVKPVVRLANRTFIYRSSNYFIAIEISSSTEISSGNFPECRISQIIPIFTTLSPRMPFVPDQPFVPLFGGKRSSASRDLRVAHWFPSSFAERTINQPPVPSSVRAVSRQAARGRSNVSGEDQSWRQAFFVDGH